MYPLPGRLVTIPFYWNFLFLNSKMCSSKTGS